VVCLEVERKGISEKSGERFRDFLPVLLVDPDVERQSFCFTSDIAWHNCFSSSFSLALKRDCSRLSSLQLPHSNEISLGMDASIAPLVASQRYIVLHGGGARAAVRFSPRPCTWRH